MSLRDIFGIALLLCFLLSVGSLAGDPGVGWHLRAGEAMVGSGAVLYEDPFLSGDTRRPWIDDQWLSDILFWKLFTWGGIGFLQAAVLGLAILVYVGILGRSVEQNTKSPLLAFMVLALLSPLASLQWFVRPVVFSFVLFTVVLTICRTWVLEPPPKSESRSWSSVWFIPPLFWLWANLHPGFPLGLIVLGLAVLFHLWSGDWAGRKTAFIIGAASVLVTFLTPYGVGLHRSILSLVSNPFFMQLNNEWKSPDFSEAVFYPFGILLLWALAALGRKGGIRNKYDAVLLVAFTAFSLFERRYLPYCGLIAAAPLADVLGRSFSSGALSKGTVGRMLRIVRGEGFLSSKLLVPRGALTCWVLILVFLVASPSGRLSHPFPDRLPAFVLDSIAGDRRGPIYHSPDLGGFFIWEYEKTGGASIDDRNQLCSQNEYEEYFDIALVRKGWKELLSRYTWAVLDPSDPVRFVIESAGWRRITDPKPAAGSERVLLYKRVAPTG